MEYGCHAVLFRERIKSETETILKGLASTGFKGVEIGSRFFGTDQKPYLVEVLDRYGIQLSGMHVGCALEDWLGKKEECIGKVRAVAEFVRDLPNKNVILSGSRALDCDFRAVAWAIEEASKVCLDMGAKLNYHNHAWEFENGGAIFDALTEHAPSLNFALDLGWVYAGGRDPAEMLKKLAGRVSYVHLRDAGDNDDKKFVNLGEGIFDYKRLVDVLKATLGNDGWAIVEYEEGEQDFERYLKARMFLEGLNKQANCI